MLFCASMYYLSMGGHLYSADNEIKGLIAEAIVERQAFTLPVSEMVYMKPGRGGLSYSSFPVGSSITMIPFYRLGAFVSGFIPEIPRTFIIEFCYSMINPLLTAITCLLLYGLCGLLGYSNRTSIIVALVFGFCSIAWPYAKTTWSEPQATLCVLAGLYGIIRFDKTGRYRWLLIGGAALGYAVLTKFEMAIYASVFSCYLLYILIRSRTKSPEVITKSLAAWGIPLFLFALAVLGYNYIRFEQWFAFRHYNAAPVESISQETSVWLDALEGILVGTYQHLFSTGKGILLFTPPLLMYYWAMKRFWQTHRPEAVLCLILPVVFLLVTGSSWIMTKISWGERYFVSLTPFLLIPLASLISEVFDHGSRYMKKSLITLMIMGFCVQILGISINFQTVVDKMGARGEEMDIQLLSYDPEFSPVLLHAQEFYARVGDTFSILADGPEAFLRNQQKTEATTDNLDLNIKSNRDLIRYYTFDYWFCYMYLMGLPSFLIIIPGVILLATVCWSGSKLYNCATAIR